jgi:phage shock protein C
MIGGVCGGIGAFLGINPVYIRVFFILLIFGNGIGILLYLLLWMIIPVDGEIDRSSLARTVRTGSQEIADRARSAQDEFVQLLREQQNRLGILAGAALIFIGFLFLLPNLHLDWLDWLKFDLIWPILLILGGLALLIRRPKEYKHDR